MRSQPVGYLKPFAVPVRNCRALPTIHLRVNKRVTTR
ncbi:Uncharacterised protein [Vibrio cholerae]|nr:Uncharacterised protein [Vibrio cholerae]